MEAAALWVSLVATMATVAAAVFAFVQAKAATDQREEAEQARDESRKARDEAAALAREANEAFKRQAEAQERANEIAQSQIPVPKVHWQVGPVDKGRWLAVNDGELTAINAKIVGTEGVMVDHDSESELVVPGDSLEFHVWQAFGMDRPRITISWEDPDGTPHEVSIAIPR